MHPLSLSNLDHFIFCFYPDYFISFTMKYFAIVLLLALFAVSAQADYSKYNARYVLFL